jgi:predicted nucleic acid-binding protein
MPDKYFWDTNLWVYLNTKSQNASDENKRKKLTASLLSIPKIVISVQVLNELANVLMKKYGHPESDTKTRLSQICNQTEVVFLTDQLTLEALGLK